MDTEEGRGPERRGTSPAPVQGCPDIPVLFHPVLPVAHPKHKYTPHADPTVTERTGSSKSPNPTLFGRLLDLQPGLEKTRHTRTLHAPNDTAGALV